MAHEPPTLGQETILALIDTGCLIRTSDGEYLARVEGRTYRLTAEAAAYVEQAILDGMATPRAVN